MVEPFNSHIAGMNRHVRVRITRIERNLPDEKRLEIQTENGDVGYYEAIYDPRTDLTTLTVYYEGEVKGCVVNPERGNHTASSMTSAFWVMPPLDKSLVVPVSN
jgi:hypothetical protein